MERKAWAYRLSLTVQAKLCSNFRMKTAKPENMSSHEPKLIEEAVDER